MLVLGGEKRCPSKLETCEGLSLLITAIPRYYKLLYE